MLKLLLVDDEQPILDGLKQLIDWSSMGIGTIETALNGREAAALLKSLKPDIIITDIRMPYMNGLELIRNAREVLPESKIIVLSGYEDFEYAREAMKYGVMGYLLKPVEEAELKEMLKKIREAFQCSIKEKERVADLNIRLGESTPFMRNKLLYSIASGETRDINAVGEKLKTFGIKDLPEKYLCAIIEFDIRNPDNGSEGENIELMRFAAANITDELVNAHTPGLVFYMLETQIIAVIDMKDCQQHTLEAIFREIIHYISSFLKIPVTIGVSRVAESFENIAASFREARSALKYKLLTGKGKAIFYEEVARDTGMEIPIPLSLGKKLENCVISGDGESIPGVVRDMFCDLKNIKGIAPADILSKCREELMLIKRSLEDMGVCLRTLNLFIEKFDAELQEMTINELERQFASALKDIATEIFNTSTAGMKAIIGQIKQYIDQNYASQITLNTIADKFYVNSSYTSRIFKQELSENFIDYLTNKRINEAIKLLVNTEMNVYEISEKIGYGNPKYFSQLFKRQTGISPREYRENLKK